MCQHKSGVAVKNGETIKVYTLVGEDSHTKIRDIHKLRDDSGAGAGFQTPVELIPVGAADLGAPETWKFVFDADQPSWWTDDMTAEAIRQLAAAEKLDWKDGVLTAGGDLDLSSLTALPATAKLTAGGDLDLRILTALPATAKLTAGGDLYLRDLTALPATAKLTAGGGLYLSSLTALPADGQVSCTKYFCQGRWHTPKKRANDPARAGLFQ